jgi:hypothetical protein
MFSRVKLKQRRPFGVAMSMVQLRHFMQLGGFWIPLRERRSGLGSKKTLINGGPKGHCVIRPLGV